MDGDASSGHGKYTADEQGREQVAFSRAWLGSAIRTPEGKLRVVLNRGAANEPDLKDGDALLVDTSFDRIVDDAFYIFERDERLLTRLTEMFRRWPHRAEDAQGGIRNAGAVPRGRGPASHLRPRAVAGRIAVRCSALSALRR